jgi:mono/diheme cytochrome c family protein
MPAGHRRDDRVRCRVSPTRIPLRVRYVLRLIVVRGVTALGCALALAFTGCGGDDSKAPATSPRTATALPLVPEVRDAPIADGQGVFARSGCLACHQLFKKGHSGPGNSLTGVGARMSPAELRRVLLRAPAPMPSYRRLAREQLDDLVAYLSALRGSATGGPQCPDDVDCG